MKTLESRSKFDSGALTCRTNLVLDYINLLSFVRIVFCFQAMAQSNLCTFLQGLESSISSMFNITVHNIFLLKDLVQICRVYISFVVNIKIIPLIKLMLSSIMVAGNRIYVDPSF